MTEQLSFLDEPKRSNLKIVKMNFIAQENTNYENLFRGFSHLYAITFSYGLDFINKISNYFEKVEIIIGCEAMVKFDLKTIMAFQTRVLEKIRKNEELIEKVSNGSLKFWIAKEVLSHQKIFILSNDYGNTRVIVGSANFSTRSFSGKQKENIGVFENDARAFEYYYDVFEEIKELSTNEIIENALYMKTSEESINDIPIIEEIKYKKVGIILDDEYDEDIAEFTYDIKNLSSKYASFMPKLQSKNGKVLVTPENVKYLIKKHKKELKEKSLNEFKVPKFEIDYNEKAITFNGKPYILESDSEQIKLDIRFIIEYFNGFDSFIGDTANLKKEYFRLMNYMFLSPFIARLRQEAYKNDFSTTLFPLYAVINGPKSAGKSAFLDTVQTIMFGQTLGGVDPTEFTKTGILTLLHEGKGIPLHIEDINRDRFNKYAGEIVKYENGILRENLFNHPVFVLTSNDIVTIKQEYAKRVYYSSVDAQLTNVVAASNHKKVAELRKKISTSFYKEYFRRMLDKVLELIEEINMFELSDENEGWKPDIFSLSSNTIIDILSENDVEAPEFMTSLKYSDYFGYNSIVENIRNKIIFEWEHNRKAFKILKKQNLIEYVAGEKSYEAIRVCDSLPEVLRAKHSGAKVIFKLDKGKEFFGIDFKKSIF